MDNMINIANQIIVYSVCYTLIFVVYGYVFYHVFKFIAQIIIDKETFIAAGREIRRRSAKLGRNDRFKEIPEKKAPILFRFGDITEYFDNPVKQAEYLYSLIESEVI